MFESKPKTPASPSAYSLFIPLFFLILTVNFFLVFEIHTILRTRAGLIHHKQTSSQEAEQLRGQVASARVYQTVLQGLAYDLLVMSNTDPEIRRLIEKYQIRKAQ